MGEVYRAHDTKLNRDVVNILPETFASDPDRLVAGSPSTRYSVWKGPGRPSSRALSARAHNAV